MRFSRKGRFPRAKRGGTEKLLALARKRTGFIDVRRSPQQRYPS
jgi:hypothetical protein